MKSSSRWVAALAVAVLSTSLAGHACGEAIEMFGYDHEPLGSAVLTAEPSSLLVGNLDSSGNSGVSIDLSDLAYEQFLWLADLEDLGSPTSHADGSFIELTSIGRVNGLSHQKLGVGRFEAVGGQVQISVDLSNATADPIYIEYRLGGPFGTLVTTENLSTRSFTGLTASSFPVSIADDVVYAGGFAKITMGAAFASAEALITPSGTLVVADWFDVFGVSETMDGFQKTTIVTGGDFTSFRITNETLIPLPEPNSITIFAMGIVGALWCARIRRRSTTAERTC